MMYGWVISSFGDRIVNQAILSQIDGIGVVFLHLGLTPFSTCWIFSPYLHFAGVRIVRFVDVPGSFFGLTSMHLSDAQVGVMVAVRSAWAVSWVGWLIVHLSRFAHGAISAVDSGHPTKCRGHKTIVCR